MELFQIIILAIIQGLTEFLPISSSAHLILPGKLLGWVDQGLAFDVAVHIGTLLAVCLYFRKECKTLLLAWCKSFTGHRSEEVTLAWIIIGATIPAVAAGLLFNDFIEANFRSIFVIASTTLLFGVLLGIADKFSQGKKTEYQVRLPQMLIIGLAQALALIPGTSRSGITMTAGLFCGMTKQGAARFSFLLSMPLILAAGIYQLEKLIVSGMDVPWMDIALGTGISFVTAYACIHWFLQWIERTGFMLFVIYRVILAAILFYLSYALV